MIDNRPGLNHRRLMSLVKRGIKRCDLDLEGKIVVTEAATGAYASTALLAAMAGAKRVFAVARASRYGTVDQIRSCFEDLAALGQVKNRIDLIEGKPREIFADADIVTNSGHLRPIDAEVASWLRPTAVVPLMYEAWEYRQGDVDLTACATRGIAVAGTNERHPAIDVFSFLGLMALKLLNDSGVAAYGSKVLLLCDNPFEPYIERTLQAAGVLLTVARDAGSLRKSGGDVYDGILVGMCPRKHFVIGDSNSLLRADEINELWPGAVVAQLWGDIDRKALDSAGVSYWPVEAPALGHMGVLPSALGPEPIVRLQAGGLKVGEVMSKTDMGQDRVARAVESGYGQRAPTPNREAVI